MAEESPLLLASALLCASHWRGNVRELRNVLERLAILSDHSVIDERDVHTLAPVESVEPAKGAAAAAVPTTPLGSGATVPSESPGIVPTLQAIRDAGGLVAARRAFERRCIELGLDTTGGNVTQTANLLLIERSNLHKKMQALGLEARPPRPAGAANDEEDE